MGTLRFLIEEAVALVPGMPAEEKLKAVQFWNVVSEKLQEIVNNSAADISALAFELEKENAAKMLGGGLEKTPDVTLSNNEHSNVIATERPVNEVPLVEQAVPANVTQQVIATNGLKLTDQLNDSTLHRSVTQQLQQQLLKSNSNSELPTSSSLAGSPSISHAISAALTIVTSGIISQSTSSAPNLTITTPPSVLNTPISLTSTSLNDTVVSSSDISLSVSDNVLSESTKVSLDSSNISIPEISSNNLNNVHLSNSTVPKLQSSKRGRGRPPGSVKRDKNEDSEWSPLEERVNRGNRRIYSSRDGFRLCARRNIRRNLLLQEMDTNEEYESDELDNDDIAVGDIEGEEEDEEEEEEEEEEDEENDKFKNGAALNGTQIELDGNPDENAENKHDKLEKTEKTVSNKKRTRRRRTECSDNYVPDGGEYTCEFCNRKFPNISSLTTHRWIHTKPYACTECSARFSTKGNLIVHKRRHTGEKPYGCSQCEARFSTKGNLKRHVKTHSGEKPWECTQCGGRFTEKKSLKVHMRRHTGEKPYQCKVCGKRFAQTGILQTHMAMHMDQKAHLCDHCGKSFRQKSQLRLHMMRHEGVRKYQCITCPARFLTKGDLERHNRIHTGERPFICELCGKTFTRQQSLNEHMNRHYGLKPYECKYCGKNFAEMSACYKHIKQHERSQIPTMQQHQVTVDSADGQKFTVLVHTDQPLDVGSEISVVQQDQGTVIPADSHITVAVTDQIGEFAAINLLASASSYQQNF